MTGSERVFVYGSLKRGLRHHDQMAGAAFLGEVALSGHHLVLYEGGYPALVESPGPPTSAVCPDTVHGELFFVTSEHLKRLDEFEECPSLYERVRVVLMSGAAAFAYRIPRERGLAYPRVSGTWTEV